MIRGFNYSSRFRSSFKKLGKDTRQEVVEKLKSFALDPFQPHYKVHKLKEDLAGWLSLTIHPDLLIVFRFTKKDNSEILLHNIGGHEIYK
jgi:mRNA-degrading endonuclease YafQ of YafQ-DinJ toxin-antitoxin module